VKADATAEMSLTPELIDCKTWLELDGAIERLAGELPYRWVFRGQRDSEWPLRPTIERTFDVQLQLQTEQRLLEEFRSKAHLYAQHLPPREDFLGWLSVMQHYGIATCLLDWTYSAYVALFFAVEAAPREEKGALWAIHHQTLHKVFLWRAKGVLRSAYGSLHGRSPEEFNNIALPPAFASDSDPGLVAAALPSFHVSRLSSQQGCFLVNCNYRMAFEESLADMMKENADVAWLVKMTFPHTLRATILRRLMHANVHPATLFPDLDGLARFLNLKNELFSYQADPRGIGRTV
jgi:hypothetical protein